MTIETKMDPLVASFAGAEEVSALRAGMAELKARLDGAAVAAARPALFGAKARGDVAGKAFVEGYLRGGSLAGVEVKAVSGAAPEAGGYAVPREIDAAIAETLIAASPIRGIAQVVQVGSAGYRKLVATGGVQSGWASEQAARPETGTPLFAEVAPPMGELFANPAATQAMLDDAAFDVEAWIADEVAREFARAEGAAFVRGDGLNKPMGFLSTPQSAQGDAVRAFGTLQCIGTGAETGFGAVSPENRLIDLVQTLRSPYRQGAVWVMNSATSAAVRKFKTADGAFVWQPGLQAGQPDTLLGYPVIEAEDMPDLAAGNTPIAFGNFRAGYLIAERAETAILRDPYSHKPFVHFYATRRVGGAVMNGEAIKLLKVAA